MATDDTDDDSSIEMQTVSVEIEAEPRLPQDGPWSFDLLADPIATGAFEDGTEVTVRATRVRDTDVLVEFGRGGPDLKTGVFFDVTGLIHAAAEAVEAVEGVSLPDPSDEKASGEGSHDE